MAARADKAALPPKEQSLFKSILKHYDTKQYKKGVKAADAVLKCATGVGGRRRQRKRRRAWQKSEHRHVPQVA